MQKKYKIYLIAVTVLITLIYYIQPNWLSEEIMISGHVLFIFILFTSALYFFAYKNNLLKPKQIMLQYAKSEQGNLDNNILHTKGINNNLINTSIIFEQSPLTILITDSIGNIESANKKFVNLTGYSIEEVIGKNARILNSGKTDKKVFDDMWQTISKGEIWIGEFINRKKNGEEFIEKATITPVKNKTGKVKNYIAIKEDVTKSKENELKLAQSEQKYRLIANNATDVIWILNLSKHKFSYISPSVFSLRGYTVSEAMQHNLNETLTLKSAKIFSDELERNALKFIKNPDAYGDTINVNELQQYCKNGDVIWIETTTRYQFNENKEIEVLGISRNIEKRKQTELALKNSEHNLLKLNEAKNKLFSIIGHDLRGPIGNAKNLLDLVISKKNISTADLLVYLKKLQKSTNSTYDLMENLLSWAQSQQNKVVFNPTTIALNKLVEPCILQLFELAKQKNITIHNQTTNEQLIYADNNMLAIIFRNLLTNAIKFTTPNKNIYVKAHSTNNEITISVKDEGVGIKPEIVEELFNPSENHSTFGTSGERGTGLGLLLCKEFVEKHDSKIWVESTVEKGSEFMFSLPIETSLQCCKV